MSATTSAAVLLPSQLETRGTAAVLVRHAVPAGTTDVAIGAVEAASVSAGAADEIVKRLLDASVQRVVLVNPQAGVERSLRLALARRSTRDRTFLLSVQHRSDDVLYPA